jgi:hypothetical protein
MTPDYPDYRAILEAFTREQLRQRLLRDEVDHAQDEVMNAVKALCEAYDRFVKIDKQWKDYEKELELIDTSQITDTNKGAPHGP